MRMGRTMSAGTIRLFSLFSVIIVVLALLPMLSHAAVFWEDELEAGTPFGVNFAIGIGAMAYDTSVKFSGSGSIRLNYPPACQTLTTQNQCGGSASRAVPQTDNLYRRAYFRMSGTGPNRSASGLFETSVLTFTKILRTTSNGINKLW